LFIEYELTMLSATIEGINTTLLRVIIFEKNGAPKRPITSINIFAINKDRINV